MRRAKVSGWLLEVARPPSMGRWYAWVSNPLGLIVGYATVPTCETDAVRAAFVDARHHYAKDDEALAGLAAAYFGQWGLI